MLLPIFAVLFLAGNAFGDKKANAFVENLLSTGYADEVSFLMLDPAPVPDFSIEFEDTMKVFGTVKGKIDFKHGTLSGLADAKRLSECHRNYPPMSPYEPVVINCTIAWEKLKVVYEGKMKYGKMPSISVKGKAKFTSSNAFLEIAKDSSRALLRKYVCLLGHMEPKLTGLGPLNRLMRPMTEDFKQQVMTKIFDTMTERLRYAFDRALTKVVFPF